MYRCTYQTSFYQVKFIYGRNSLPQLQCSPSASITPCCRYRTKSLIRKRTKLERPVETIDIIQLPSQLIKPAIFTALFSAVSLTGVAIWRRKNVHKRIEKWKANRIEPEKLLRWQSMMPMRETPSRMRHAPHISKRYNTNIQVLEAFKVSLSILFVNVVIFLARKIPSMRNFAYQYSLHRNIYLTMLSSCFSHQNALHLVLNFVMLQSVLPKAVAALDKEQFFALYFISGVLAAFTNLVLCVLTKKSSVTMLGANGCMVGIFSYLCFAYPNKTVFFPGSVTSLQSGLTIKALMVFHFVGLFTRFFFSFHAIHLGGALTGLLWSMCGDKYWWHLRWYITEYWDQINGQKK